MSGKLVQTFVSTNGLQVWVALTAPGTIPGIVALRDKQQHHQRRKLWNHGFTSASIKELQPSLESRVLELVEELSKRACPKAKENVNSIDLALWFSNFT